LSNPTLTDLLRATIDLLTTVTQDDPVRAGALVDGAYRRFAVKGVGESFATKWLWAASLSTTTPLRPLILDNRVRALMYRLLRHHSDWVIPRGGTGYVDYVNTLRTASELLTARFQHVDAEKIEWLLFDRSNHESDSEACFNDTVR
jgi:hypothetical protein